MSVGYRSHHSIDLGTMNSVFPPTASRPVSTQHPTRPTFPSTHAQAVTAPSGAAPKNPLAKSSLQQTIEKEKTKESQLRYEAQHDAPSDVNPLVPSSSTSDAISISTFHGSHGKFSPPGSPRARPSQPLLLTNDDNDDFSASLSRKSAAEMQLTSRTCWSSSQPFLRTVWLRLTTFRLYNPWRFDSRRRT